MEPVLAPSMPPLVATPGPACVGESHAAPADSPESPCGLMGGGTLYLLKPFFTNNSSFLVVSNPNLPNSQVTTNNFHWDYNPAAAFWVGWNCDDGLGVRARYFHFDQRTRLMPITNASSPAPQTQVLPSQNVPALSGFAFGSPGVVLGGGFGTDSLTFGSNLQIDFVDVEATYAWRAQGWSLLASAGGRYLDMSQNYRAALLNTGDGMPVSELELLNSGHKFYGGGPTVGVQATWGIGPTGVSVFASARGTLLVGTVDQTTAFTQLISDPTSLVGGDQNNNPRNNSTLDHVIPIAELELGLQYAFDLRKAQVFVRTAVVNHTYFDAGNASQTTGNLSLFGVQGSLGLNY
jgi:hypothetical protein